MQQVQKSSLDKATKTLEQSKSDKEEDSAISEIANKISTDDEAESNAINKIQLEEKAARKQFNIKGEIQMLKSNNFDELLEEGNREK